MTRISKQYIQTHIRDLHGVIPEPGTEWRMRETEMTKETHQGHIQTLHHEGAIVRVRSDRWGVIWETTPTFAEVLRDISESREGLSAEDALIGQGQTDLEQFARASG